MGEIFVRLDEFKIKYKFMEKNINIIFEEYEDYINLKNYIKYGHLLKMETPIETEIKRVIKGLTEREKCEIISEKHKEYGELKDYLKGN